MLKVYTSNYRYGGDDRFDISVKGKLHPEFAPTWPMVKGIKEGTMNEDEYTRLYRDLMINTRRQNVQYVNTKYSTRGEKIFVKDVSRWKRRINTIKQKEKR